MSTYKPRTEEQKAARRARESNGRVRFSRRSIPACTAPHKTGAALIAHIAAFDKARNLRSGSRYIIGGREVTV